MNRVCHKRKKKKIHLFKTLFILLILVVGVYFWYEYKVNGDFDNVIQTVSKINLTKVNTLDQNYSSNNYIKGQSLVEDQDGYTTIFTTLNDKHKKTYKEFKQNNNASWSENSYWGGTMSENGCGITSLAIVASGYGFEITPEDLRKKYYPHLDGDEMKSALKKLGFKCTDFYFHESYLNKRYITDWLRTNRPIIICVGNDIENNWTNSSHYMVLLDIDDKGLIYVSNPNGLDGEDNSSRLV